MCEGMSVKCRSESMAGEQERRTVDAGSLDHVDVVELVLDLDGDDVVGLVHHLGEDTRERQSVCLLQSRRAP